MIELYKKLYLIRKVEEKIQKHYYEDEMKTPMHMSMGEEGIAAGVCHALRKKDQIFGTHRSHAIYLAKTGDTDKFFAEMHGKKTGMAQGKAGSMHLSNIPYGFMTASSIVGGNFAMSAGAAYANKRLNNGKIVVDFFGDGATEEGSFWESINISCLFELPIIFLCEDNDVAVYTNASKRHGYSNITDIISKFNLYTEESDTTDADVIYEITKKCINYIKKYKQPCFLKLKYYRYLDHVGVQEDFHPTYRNKKDFKKWMKKDSVKLYRKKMLKQYSIKELNKIELEIIKKINNSFKKAQKASYVSIKNLCKDTYYE